MTAPNPSGGPSPLRVGALALLGVGAVAAIIGIGTLVTGGGSSSTAAAPTSAPSSTTAPVTPSAVATPSAAVPVPVFPATSTNALAAPTAAAGAGGAGASGSGSGSSGSAGGVAGSAGSGGGGGGGGSVVKSPVRVYNNSTIKGLAARAGDDFRNDGWTVTAVANYPYGNIPTSTVYYRPGTAEQAGAEAMGAEFGMRVEPRFVGLDDASPGIIAIVTNDYQKRG